MKSVMLGAGLAAVTATGLWAQDIPAKLVLGTEGAYPPFNATKSDGTVEGFEIDLGNAMCAEIGVECEWVTQDWDGIIPGLLGKKYDAIIASLYITDERRKVIAFSDKYYQVPARFMVADDSDIEISAEGLSGKVVGTQRATSFERFITDKMPDVEVRLYGTMDEAYLDLASGRVDAVLGDAVALVDGFLKTDDGEGFELRGPEYTGAEWFGYGAGVAVRQDDQAIADAFSDAIKALRADGTYEEISNKWFGIDVYGG
ncbi:transporter substrate-binding domain-containing protein [Phaeobacter sp. HF9A]|nr:transporter substrate-binding domain-containing protein [Phaeobacter sp. HF9A]